MKAGIKYHIIYRHRAEYPVAAMFEFFGVSRSGYYAFVHRLGRPEKDAALAEVIAQQRERKLDQRIFLIIPFQGSLSVKGRHEALPMLVRHHLQFRFAQFLFFARHIQTDARKRAIKNSLVLCFTVHSNPPNVILNG